MTTANTKAHEKPTALDARARLKEPILRRWIDQLLTGRDNTGTTGRFGKLHAEIAKRDQQFFGEAKPQFDPPFDKYQTYSSDVIRRTHQKAKARLEEHPIRVTVKPPRQTGPQRTAAESLAVVFETGTELVEEAGGFSIVGQLADGQIRHSYGVLHWYALHDLYPEYPSPEEADELPDDEGEAARYRPTTAADKVGKFKTDKKYRETEEQVAERDKRARALAGFPWVIEVPRPDEFAFTRDRSRGKDRCLNGMAVGVTMQTIGRLEYQDGVEADGYCLSLHDRDAKVLIWDEVASPIDSDPSGDAHGWGDRLRVARVWTRDAWYELVAQEKTGEFCLVRSGIHPYKMPPFALATATTLNDADPLRAFPPFLQGLYKTVPDYEYERSLGRFIAEASAMPRYWVELAGGEFWLDRQGARVILTTDALSAEALPPGAKLVHAEITVDPAFVGFLEMSAKDVADATPETGFVDVGASTAPHTLNMAQAQANAEVADLKSSIALCLRTMYRNMAMTMSLPAEEGGFGDVVWVLAKRDRGGVKAGTLVGVEPDKIPSLDIDVTINPNSGAQQIAVAEYYRGLVNDEKIPFGPLEWLEKTGDEHPEQTMSDYIAEMAELKADSLMVQQELMRAYGDVFVLMPGGGIGNINGGVTDPAAALATQGVKVQTPPMPATVGPQSTAPLGQLPPLQPEGPPVGAQTGTVA